MEVLARKEESRLHAAVVLLRRLLRFHRKPFLIAVAGAAVYATGTVASSFAISRMVDRAIQPFFRGDGSVVTAFWAACLLIALIGAIRAVAVVVRRSFAGVTQWRTAATLAELLIRSILRRPHAWHMRHQPGDLVARVGVDADAAVVMLGPLPYATSVLILVGLAGYALIRVDVMLGSLALVVLPLMLLLNVAYQRRVDRHFDAAQHALGAFSEAAYESLEGYSVVKAFGAETRETQRMATISRQLREARIRAIKGRATFDGLMDAVPALINVTLIVVGAYRVGDGAISVGELSGFVYLFTLLVFPLRIVGYVFSEFPRSRSGMDRVQAILGEPLVADPAIRDVTDQSMAVELSGVSVVLEGSTVLDDVSLKLARGSMVALVGPTGAGKSTLLSVLAGLIGPTRGSVAVARGRTSIVLQDPFLFDGTIRENVLLGTGDETLLADALYLSNSLEFIEQLPDGYETEIGERGVGLSGGQRQRVCLARALCRINEVLLLDDTTSALDTHNENAVLEHLANLVPRPTIIIATSRPSVIRFADVIMFMQHGRVVQVGQHEALIESNVDYRELVGSYDSKLGSA